jgi:hypothetical protein
MGFIKSEEENDGNFFWLDVIPSGDRLSQLYKAAIRVNLENQNVISLAYHGILLCRVFIPYSQWRHSLSRRFNHFHCVIYLSPDAISQFHPSYHFGMIEKSFLKCWS